MSKKIIVIGGGVIGLSTAYYAVLNGHDVTVLDSRPSGYEGCSFGNAGLVVPSHIVPLAAPGAFSLALKWMWNPESPFWVKPRFDRDLIRWGLAFKKAATEERVERAAPLLRDLHLASRLLFADLSGDCDDFGFKTKGLMMLCNTEKGLAAELHEANRAESLGIHSETLGIDEIRSLEPGLELSVTGGVFYPKDAWLDPPALMRSLVNRLGGTKVPVRFGTEVTGWKSSNGAIDAVRTTAGEMVADEYVLCTGSWSQALVRDLGIDLPVQAGKGYSLTLDRAPKKPAHALILSESRVAVTPMGDGVRFGGTMEIAGLNESITPRRVLGIAKSVHRYMPDYDLKSFFGIPAWCGLRPCSPDGLPFVGRTSRFSNLVFGTGHAMMGVSLGPITGKLIAEILSGVEPSIPIELLSPDRYTNEGADE